MNKTIMSLPTFKSRKPWEISQVTETLHVSKAVIVILFIYYQISYSGFKSYCELLHHIPGLLITE